MTISDDLRARIRVQAEDRCGYCQSSQRYVFAPLEIDHLLPTSLGGTDDEENLWLACRMCNNFKGTQIRGRDPATGQETTLFNPRHQMWSEHFTWNEDGTQIVRLTSCGQTTALALQMNNVIAVMVRRERVGAGWHPPK